MKITTKAVYDIETGNLLEWEGYEHDGPVALCKGASSSENAINEQQQQFYNTLQSDYGKQFANQSNILNSLQKSLTPIVAAGPSQFGYSKGQTNALNSTAIQNAAASNRQVQQQLQNQQAVAGGGNEFLPSGVNAQVNAQVASNSANDLSNNLLNIQNAGYQQGNQNYNNAIAGMGGVAQQYSPSQYAENASKAGGEAMGGAADIQKQNTSASPWGAIGGILGGPLGQAAVGGVGTAVSKMGSGNWGW